MLTVAEAAKRAGRDPETIRRWIRAGRLPAWKAGGQHMIDKAALEDALRPVPVGERSAGEPHERAGARGHGVGEAAVAYGSAAEPSPSTASALDTRLPWIVGRIVRAVDPVRVVLFGARLHGDASPDAEYGLVVVLDEVADRWRTAVDVRFAFAELPVFARVLVASRAEAEGSVEPPPLDLVTWPLREGLTIYDRDRAR